MASASAMSVTRWSTTRSVLRACLKDKQRAEKTGVADDVGSKPCASSALRAMRTEHQAEKALAIAMSANGVFGVEMSKAIDAILGAGSAANTNVYNRRGQSAAARSATEGKSELVRKFASGKGVFLPESFVWSSRSLDALAVFYIYSHRFDTRSRSEIDNSICAKAEKEFGEPLLAQSYVEVGCC